MREQRLTLCLCGKRRWSEGQGTSRKGRGPQRGEEREKEEEDDERSRERCYNVKLAAELLLNELQPVFFVDFKHKRELYQCQTIYC